MILASASPRRRQLLQSLGIDFECRPVDADESLDPQEQEHPALYIAKRKSDLALKLYPGHWIVACDTVVESPQGQYLGKPSDRDDARRMLLALSGKWHRVVTGHVVASPGGEIASAATATSVRFRELDERLLGWYLNSEEWTDKAGAYGIQEKGTLLVQELRGDYFNVVGLSLTTLYELFLGLGADLAGPEFAK
ncbi:MAG: septum formation protein Maf [Leptospiraceae bacterium]|nr:septum formation protein Maf [Leptospiraceae bacterium]